MRHARRRRLLEPLTIRLRQATGTDETALLPHSAPDLGNGSDQRLVDGVDTIEFENHSIGMVLTNHAPNGLGEVDLLGPLDVTGREPHKEPIRPSLSRQVP